MYELVLINTETLEEDELVCTGTMQTLEDHREYMITQIEDEGNDWPIIIIQPAA